MKIKVMRSSTVSHECEASAEAVHEMIDQGIMVSILEATANELNRVLPAWKGQYRRPVYSSAGWLFKAGVA